MTFIYILKLQRNGKNDSLLDPTNHTVILCPIRAPSRFNRRVKHSLMLCIQIGRLPWQPFAFCLFCQSLVPREYYILYWICMCIFTGARLFYPLHQPVNILLIRLANTYFFLAFNVFEFFLLIFGEKMVFCFLLTCDLNTVLICWVQEKNGEIFFFFMSSQEVKECLCMFPFHCNRRCIIIAVMLKLPRFFHLF